jgi:hypothetical protein
VRHHGTSGAKWVTVAILVYVNLINYMDRLTIAGRSFITEPHILYVKRIVITVYGVF